MQRQMTVFELYSAPIATEATPITLNGARLPVAGMLVVQILQLVPDSTRVVYVSNATTPDCYLSYIVLLQLLLQQVLLLLNGTIAR